MGQSELFKPFEDMMFLLAKGGIETTKNILTPSYTIFLRKKGLYAYAKHMHTPFF